MDDVPPGHTLYCPLENGPVVLANFEGAIHAVSGICLHKLNTLDGATMSGPCIECPYHHFQYDVRTGANYFPQNLYPKNVPGLDATLKPLKVYPVQLIQDEIWVNTDE